MKLLLPFLLSLSLTSTASANENWIPITPVDKPQSLKQSAKLDVNLSQVGPVKKIMKTATVIKQLIDTTSKKEIVTTKDKNWFVLGSEESK
ncbi:hypothetical protein [Sulfurimonas sp.]|uniref:hypothetical protein n=1 Tax=Sulfurimonas sp. TaxID=2022749 RepID=UPI0019F8BA18|nr:hypothetical protein [Sulfurimonas sp.]MBE0515539.1 hypothetical protein [Sulfurimonas sp.]